MQRQAVYYAEEPLHFKEAVEGISLIGVDVTVAGKSGGDITPHLPWLGQALREFSSYGFTGWQDSGA